MTAALVVVDTNVPVVANGRDTHADSACQRACLGALLEVTSKRTVVLDEGRLILGEYERNLGLTGWQREDGVGDAFLEHVHNHQYNGARVRRVGTTPIDDERRGFEELPPNDLDPDDRKFLAAAVVARAPIMNATDSDWIEQQALLGRVSVALEQLC